LRALVRLRFVEIDPMKVAELLHKKGDTPVPK
jgi:hypothetical protein